MINLVPKQGLKRVKLEQERRYLSAESLLFLFFTTQALYFTIPLLVWTSLFPFIFFLSVLSLSCPLTSENLNCPGLV
jgi:hypothetical protein